MVGINNISLAVRKSLCITLYALFSVFSWSCSERVVPPPKPADLVWDVPSELNIALGDTQLVQIGVIIYSLSSDLSIVCKSVPDSFEIHIDTTSMATGNRKLQLLGQPDTLFTPFSFGRKYILDLLVVAVDTGYSKVVAKGTFRNYCFQAMLPDSNSSYPSYTWGKSFWIRSF